MGDLEDLARLIHQVNNLLAVIQTQAAVAMARGDLEAAQEALRQIEATAARTEALVRELRRAGAAGGDGG